MTEPPRPVPAWLRATFGRLEPQWMRTDGSGVRLRVAVGRGAVTITVQADDASRRYPWQGQGVCVGYADREGVGEPEAAALCGALGPRLAALWPRLAPGAGRSGPAAAAVAAFVEGRWAEGLAAWSELGPGGGPHHRAVRALGAALLGLPARELLDPDLPGEVAVAVAFHLGAPGGGPALERGAATVGGAAGAVRPVRALGAAGLGDGEALLRQAELLLRDGDADGARAVLAPPASADPGRLAELRARAGDPAWARDLPVGAQRVRARVALWLGDPSPAARLADAPDPEARLLAGAAAVLERRDARPWLADLPGAEAALWRAEGAWDRGDVDGAEAELEQARRASPGPIAALLHLRFALAGPDPHAAVTRGLDGFAWEVAPHWLGVGADASTAELSAAAEAAWRRLGGCRTATPTEVRGDRLVSLSLPPGSRGACSAALRALPWVGPEAVLAQLDGLGRTYPRSPHPGCYAGELLLWWGRYEEAAQRLRSGLRRRTARWGWIGWSASADLRGLSGVAERLERRGLRDFPELPGSTLHGYRGARRRRAGAFADARQDLGSAVAIRPQRVGAWVDLGLVAAATGDAGTLRRCLTEVEARAPGLLWWARREPDCGPTAAPEVLLHAANRLLAGNRASSRTTVLRGDRLLALAPPDAVRAVARAIEVALAPEAAAPDEGAGAGRAVRRGRAAPGG